MNDFLVFRKMVTPLLVQILFWIGVFVSWTKGLYSLYGDTLNLPIPDGIQPVPSGWDPLIYFIFFPLIFRIICENLILFFRMNATLTDIRKNTLSH